MSSAGDVFPDGLLEDAAELGAVDDRGVRVWVRQPGAAEISARLEVEGQAPVQCSVPLSAETDWTGAIVLSLPAPAPDRPFVCIAGGRRLMGRLAPAPATHGGLTFAFGSCHLPFTVQKDTMFTVKRRPSPAHRALLRLFAAHRDARVTLNREAGIYPAMVDELRRETARLLLLLGDQFYSDELAPVSIHTHHGGSEAAPPSPARALEAYRLVCRGFFGQTGIRALREALPTYCMWDDHDIFKDWGSRVDRSPLDLRLFEAAARTYGEYQHTRNPGGAIGPPPYQYHFRHGDVGFLVLDLRGARDIRRHRVLGAAQWDAVRDYLRGDDGRTVQTLFVGASVPIAHVSRWLVHLFEHIPGDIVSETRERWASAPCVNERDALLEELFTWQTAAPRRQVIVLSGDVHAASAFTIRRRRGPGVVQQFTSSPLTTFPTRAESLLNVVSTRGPNLFEPHLRFRRRLLVLRNNYGLVRVDPLPEGGHRVQFTVRVWDVPTRALVTAAQFVTRPPSR